jgi:hypothetical protein
MQTSELETTQSPLNPLNPKTQLFTITKTNWSMLFKEIIAVYSEDNKKPINTFYGQDALLLNVKAGGTHILPFGLKRLM